MGRRHRNRRRQGQTDYMALAAREGRLVAVSPKMSRIGLDGELILALRDLDAVIKDMREGLQYPSVPEDGETAVKRYLLYISMLIDCVLPDIVMSAIATHDVMVQMKLRSLLEYSATAVYYDAHPAYALYMMTVCEAESVLRKLIRAGSSSEGIAAAEEHAADMRAKFPVAKGMGEIGFDKILGEYGDPDDYVWLYGAPSALLHGHPEGMRVLLEQRPDGSQVPNLVFDLEQVNAMLVDAGRNALIFCDRFVGRFRPGQDVYTKRLADLNRRFLELLLKHPSGRDEDDIASVRIELAALAASS